MTNFCPGKHTSLNFEYKDMFKPRQVCSKSNSSMVATLKIVFVCVNKGSKGRSDFFYGHEKKKRKNLWFQFKARF